MSILYQIQFYVYSFCIFLFTTYSYVVYYGNTMSSYFNEELLSEYDYIIVGSGTAGSLIAHRLATETNFTFVVLEAGSRSQALMDMPIVGPAIHRSIFDWKFETVSQEHGCHAMIDNKCRLPQGKIVGGSSKLNNMVYFRGNITHYFEWFHGAQTEYSIRDHFEYIEEKFLYLNDAQYETELTEAVLDAALELGYSKLGLESKQGFGRSKLSQKNGKRWSMSDNLKQEHIVTNTLVDKVLTSRNSAYGVRAIRSGKSKNIYARKGVIISAGTFNSPKILQLSGIGPANLLKELQIKVVKDLPVGKNLQDHIATGLDLIMFDKPLSISGGDILNPINSWYYFLYGKGPLTTPGCEVIGFLSTNNETSTDLQFMVLPTGLTTDRGSKLRKSLGIKDEVWDEYFSKTFHKHTATILPILLHPKSRGTVFVQSKDPLIPPLIDPKYLSSRQDRENLVKGLNLVTKFVATKSLKDINSYINPNPFPGCKRENSLDDYWQCYIKQLTLPSFHPVGTCSMGLPDSKHSVVDVSFKVIGIDHLFVVDGSVLPTLPSGNINAAIAMMANVFFDTNIQHTTSKLRKHRNQLFCYKSEIVYDMFLKCCLAVTNLSGNNL